MEFAGYIFSERFDPAYERGSNIENNVVCPNGTIMDEGYTTFACS